MKNRLASLLFLAMLSATYALHAQSYIEFPDSNASWILGFQDDWPGTPPQYSAANFFDRGDTIINGWNYRKVFNSYGDYVSAFRKISADSIMIVPLDSLTEYLLYDFSIQVGDSITVWSYGLFPGLNTVMCDYIQDSIEINGGLSKLFHFEPNGQWYSGLGGEEGPFTTDYIPSLSGGFFLQCVSVNGIPIYSPYDDCHGVGINTIRSNNSLSLSPNPTQSQLTINLATPANQVTIRVYDLQGRKMNCQFRIANFELNSVQLNTEKLPDGFYTLHISNTKTGENETATFVKQE